MDSKSLEDIKGNPKNPRTISKQDFDALKQSILKFGDLSGMIYNVRTERLAGGHQRREAFRAMSGDKQIIITQRFDTPTPQGTSAIGYVQFNGEQYPYREVDWDEGTELAANIAANRISGEFDLDLLAQVNYEISQMENAEELLGLTGQTEDEINKLLDMVGANGESDPSEDEAPEVDEVNPAVSKLGEIYQLGSHRLMCGDATKAADVALLMDGAKADISFTSPPYNASKNSHLNGEVSGFDDKYKTHDDAMSDDDYLVLLECSTMNALEKSDYTFVNLQLLTHNRQPLMRFQTAMTDYLKDILIWVKSTAPPNIVKGAFNTRWEYVFAFSKDNKTRGFPADWQGKYPNIIETENNSGNDYAEDHKAGYPIAFPSWIISKLKFASIVIDLFGGTGTTLIACEQLNRICYMMELDPKYCDVIRKRYAKHINQEDWIAATPMIQSSKDGATEVTPTNA